jgi:4'-phosphopantetheinyl transferase
MGKRYEADLDERSVHIWPVRLEAAEEVVTALGRLLSPDEGERARRFYFDHLRRRYVIARAVLRLLLARYLETSPERIRFRYGKRGKPAVDAGDLQFNLSHSESMALLAVTRKCEVGIDLEELRPVPDCLDLAERLFCREEAAELRSLPATDREKAFLVCWTRKEAYVKAVGDGLSALLDAFRVTLRPGEPARFLQIGDDESPDTRWALHDVSQCLPQHAAALAYPDASRRIHVQPLLDPAMRFHLRHSDCVATPRV